MAINAFAGKYSLCGLTFATPFVCPELLPSEAEPDVVVRFENIDDSAIVWNKQGVCYKAGREQYLLMVKGIARYLLTNGKHILIEKHLGADEDSLRLFLYNEVVAALLAQRGMLVLKASVVARNGKAFVLLGSTSVGKSLTAAGLGDKGYVIVSDGVCAINEQGAVLPGFPALMLWKKGLLELGLSPESYKPVRPGMNKFFFPVKQNFIHEALPVTGVYLLSEHNKKELASSPIDGADKFFTILSHGYFPELVQSMGLGGVVNQLVVQTAKQANMRKVAFNMSANPFGDYIGFLKNELEK